jgi:Lrp/AsnC family leucine-responsive transcriptional regulator
MDLDVTDYKILRAIQADGRISNQELSAQVGLSPSPCLRRLRALESAGVIRQYVALVDPSAVGLDVTAFIHVRLNRQSEQTLEQFEAAVTSFPEVMDCYLMTGENDYQLRILVSSLAAFETFMRDKLTRIDCISQITSSFALRPIISRTALPG